MKKDLIIKFNCTYNTILCKRSLSQAAISFFLNELLIHKKNLYTRKAGIKAMAIRPWINSDLLIRAKIDISTLHLIILYRIFLNLGSKI